MGDPRDESGPVIRLARPTDVPHFATVERAAGAAFRELDMASVSEDDPLPVDELNAYQQAGRAWVAADAENPPIAYLLIDEVDGAAHVEQVSVHPDRSRRGIGRTLLNAADAWADQQGLSGLTLTTFATVPWNAPYYLRLGFQVVGEADWTPGIRRIREHEADLGLDAWPRVVMARRRKGRS